MHPNNSDTSELAIFQNREQLDRLQDAMHESAQKDRRWATAYVAAGVAYAAIAKEVDNQPAEILFGLFSAGSLATSGLLGYYSVTTRGEEKRVERVKEYLFPIPNPTSSSEKLT